MPRVSIADLFETYRSGQPLAMVTAYDAPLARLVDEAGVDLVLVGDSAGNNHHGYEGTLPVTLEEALSNTAAVSRAVEDAMVVGDLPFLSYGASMERSVENAGRFLKEAGADAVKLETAPDGETTIALTERLTELGIPVQAHIGFTPQRMGQIGGPYVQGRGHENSTTVEALVRTAERLEDAGAFSIVLEMITEETGRRVTEAVDVPTIGIGAGRYVDGQVLVITDLLGLGDESFRFAKRYADLGTEVREAVARYAEEVRSGAFPAEEHVFDPVED